MADVALRAGVSVSTVSHVLNGTRKVSQATARAVEDAVRAVGYTPNVLARALARSTSPIVFFNSKLEAAFSVRYGLKSIGITSAT